jgi:hypothetical protein
MRLCEVGPQDRCEHKLSVREIPKDKVAQPLLATGPALHSILRQIIFLSYNHDYVCPDANQTCYMCCCYAESAKLNVSGDLQRNRTAIAQ